MSVVLLLEDDAGLQFMIREALLEKGHVVHVASNNEAGMNMLRRFTPDVLLLDLMTEDGLSTDVANYAVYSALNAAVIFMTGRGLFPKGELFRMTHNARLILRKPINIIELSNMIDHFTLQRETEKLPLSA